MVTVPHRPDPRAASEVEADAWAALLAYADALAAARLWPDALRICQDVLRWQPDHQPALRRLAAVALGDARIDEALMAVRRIVPSAADVPLLNACAVALWTRACHAEALALLDQAAALAPEASEIHNLRGAVLGALGRHDAALAAFDAALRLDPAHADAWSNRASALQVLTRPDEALAALARAVALAPERTALRERLADALAGQHRFAEAAAADRAVLDRAPDRTDRWVRMAHHLGLAGQAEAALAAAEHVLARDPGNGAALHARLLALRDLARHAEAVDTAERLAAIDPESASARWLGAMSRLALGDYDRGWRAFEARHTAVRRPPMPGDQPIELTAPLWLGETPLAGRTILLLAEQGLGDTIQFCRYAPLLARQGRVVLMVPPALARLMRGLDGDITVISPGDELPRYDLYCPMMSLPLTFGTRIATIPAQTPYLRAPADLARAWRARRAALPGRHVGLVWAGGTRPENPNAHAVDRRRSLALADFAPLAAVDGVSFVSLQVGPGSAQARTPPRGMSVHDWTDGLTDFAETAAVVEGLDLVISVDTAVAHLAGALGRPVWILNRFDACWRWLVDRSDSPWYPTARLFRQPAPGDWASVIAAVGAALRAWRGGDAGGEGGC